MLRRFGLLAFLSIITAVACTSAVAATADVKDFGAKGDGETNDSAAFQQAFSSGNESVHIPAGTFVLGPDRLSIPASITVSGEGATTVIKLAKGTAIILALGQGAKLSALSIDGADGLSGGTGDGVIKLPRGAGHATIDSVSFRNCDRACIVTDHADDLLVQNCRFNKIGLAVSIQYSNRARIINNNVSDARLHGIQFWGNWKWQMKDCSDITITGNHVKNGGGGAIWGTGAKRVTMTGNSVDGARDVGLDAEWCEDVTISNNTVRNFVNAGVGLFYSCERVTISGNTITNNLPISNPDAAWWVRSGIWLTSPNTKRFPGDTGNKDVTITKNTIYTGEGKRRAMWIGAHATNIVLSDNTIRGGQIWQGASHLQKISDDTTIVDSGD